MIKNEAIKRKCFENIKLWENTIKKFGSNQNIEKKQVKYNNVNDCVKFNSDERYSCIKYFIEKEKDLRYCFKYLSGSLKNRCVNNYFNEIVKYDLKQALSTKNSIWCDKI